MRRAWNTKHVDVAENTVVAGVPAVAIRQIDNTTLDEGCAK